MTLELTRDEALALDAALWHYILKLEAEPKGRNNIKEHAIRKAKHLVQVKQLRERVTSGAWRSR